MQAGTDTAQDFAGMIRGGVKTDYQPASLFVTEHVRCTYACRACEETVVSAEWPAAPIDKGRPGPGLLAQVVTAKYADHGVPRMRTQAAARRNGAMLRKR